MFGWTKQRLVDRARERTSHFLETVRTGAVIGVWVRKLLEGLYVIAFTDGYTQALKDQVQARRSLEKDQQQVF